MALIQGVHTYTFGDVDDCSMEIRILPFSGFQLSSGCSSWNVNCQTPLPLQLPPEAQSLLTISSERNSWSINCVISTSLLQLSNDSHGQKNPTGLRSSVFSSSRPFLWVLPLCDCPPPDKFCIQCASRTFCFEQPSLYIVLVLY